MLWLAESLELLCGGALPETPGSPEGGAGWLPGVPICAKADEVKLPKVNNAAVNSKSRNFIAKPRFSARAGL